jgi:uncharacterized caspase-like protein
MPRLGKMIAPLLALLSLVLVFAPSAARAEKRVALVVGNAGYQADALTTPANDAGLIAQTLQAAGFDVAGARDLDQDSLRRTFRDFLEKATNAGPDTVAFVYVSGYGVQLEGENYIVPIDAKIARDSDIAAQALRLSDYTRPLAALKLKASIVVLDAARANPFARSGPPLAGGLALVEPEPGVLMAFNAAPGTVAPEGPGPYGPYAQALAEMIRDGGLPLASVFDRARLRVNDMTKGAQVPWHASKVETSFVFFERAPDAPPPAASTEQAVALRAQPMRELPAQEAYAAALDRDTLDGYSEFLAAYPGDPMAKRVRAIMAARREALTWRRTRVVDTPPAYWSYLRRYPQGPHAFDARRRLAFLAAVLEPPPSFAMLAYDLPPPPPEEVVYIRRPVLVFDDPVFAFAPPPPPPIVFLAPPPPEFVVLPPPPPPVALFVLPIPVYRPVPVWVRPPAYVAPPPNNVIYANVHNTVVVNNVTNTVTITNPSGQTQTVTPAALPVGVPAVSSAPGAPAASPAAAPAPAGVGPALPPSIAQKAATLQSQSPQGAGAPTSASPPAANQLPGQAGQQPLPGRQGRPLPSATSGTAAATPSGPATNAKPGGAPTPGGAAPAATTPSAAITPTTSTPNTRGKRGAPPSQVPSAKPTTPSSPSNATAPTTSTPAKPSAAITPATPSSTPAPSGAAKPPQGPTPHVPLPTAKLGPPSASPPPANVKPATPPASPPPAAKLTPPPPPPPAAKAVTPPPAPASAATKSAPSPPGPKVAQPQPKGCPPGKTAAVVNGHPTCK